jgi:hypothetical protein
VRVFSGSPALPAVPVPNPRSPPGRILLQGDPLSPRDGNGEQLVACHFR